MTDNFDTCRVCDHPAEVLQEWDKTRMCHSCVTMFWFADVLMESEVTETEIVPTLAFALHAEALREIRDPQQRIAEAREALVRYPVVEVTEFVRGVPVLRMKEALAEAVRYPKSELARTVRVRVLSRYARPDAVAALYGEVCKREGLPIHGSSAGSISWDCSEMHLKVRVGPREEIHASRLGHFDEYPRVRRFAFPLPSVVEAVVRALLGRGQNKNLMFGALLSDLGRKPRMHPETAVTACVLWHLRGEWVGGKPKVPRSEEAARLINRLLLRPLDKPPIDITRNDAIWRDAAKVAHRFDRCRFLLQKLRDNPFQKQLSTAP
jgi:hypothetical protein